MKLKAVLKDILSQEELDNVEDCDINGISIDSNSVKPGDLFICLKGVNNDGNKFVDEALKNGAVYVLTDDRSNKRGFWVEDTRHAYSIASKNFFQSVCDKLKIIGVTGTNGKTTTTFLISEILKGAGLNVGIVGTEGARYNGKIIETGMTTPDPFMLHKIFSDMYKNDIEYVVMEVSAHALDLKKVDGIKFEIGVLTNITEDHLDYFKTMGNYAKAKLSFFDKEHVKLGVVCADDDYAQTILDKTNIPLLSYGLDNPSDTFAVNIDSNFDNTTFFCNCLDDVFAIKTNLIGKYNVENTLAGITVCRALSVPVNLIQMSLRFSKPVEGRFNVVSCKGFNVVIDYAHTPDGLEKVISTARDLTKGKLITLFGCGGNRDRQKRPIMGKVASDNSDFVVLTSDNPRFEEPMSIINEIERGMHGDYIIEPDRRKAIVKALDLCKKDDTLIIAGKGGEKYQDIKGQKLPYNDFDEVYGYFRNQISEVGAGGIDQ